MKLMKNRLKGFIGLLLSIIMVFQTAAPAFAAQLSNDYTDNESYETLLEDEDFQASLAELDELAQQYYDYYQEYGEYPSSDTELYISANTAINYLNTAGFAITSSAFAELAASLGSLAGIGTALPAVIVVCIILGVTYAACTSDLSSSGVKKLGSKASSVATEVGAHVTTNRTKAKSNAREAVITSADYWNNRREYQYFECVTTNIDGLGGVIVGKPLTEAEALARVKKNVKFKYDVFCVSAAAASALAVAASDDGIPYFHFAHIETEHGTRPYNLEHYHASIDGDIGNAHIFFEPDVW